MNRNLYLIFLALLYLSCGKEASAPSNNTASQSAISLASQTGRYQLANYRVTVNTVQRTPQGPKSQTEENLELLRIDTWTGRVDKYHKTIFVDEQGNIDLE